MVNHGYPCFDKALTTKSTQLRQTSTISDKTSTKLRQHFDDATTKLRQNFDNTSTNGVHLGTQRLPLIGHIKNLHDEAWPTMVTHG